MAISQKITDQSKAAPKSAAQNTAVGSSSRPGMSSSHKIESSAPANEHEMGRAPAGWLK